jgi:hypothetical protein
MGTPLRPFLRRNIDRNQIALSREKFAGNRALLRNINVPHRNRHEWPG